MNLEALCKMVADLKTQKEEIEERLKQTNKSLEEASKQLIEAATNEGLSSMKIPGLGSFSFSEKEYFSIKADNKEATLAAFKTYFPELVKETINGNSLSAFMREAKSSDQKLPEEIVEGIVSYAKPSVSWRRST